MRVFLIACVLSTAPGAQQVRGSPQPPQPPGLVSPERQALGESYAHWGAAWWEWFLQIPCQASHPGNCGPSFDVTLGQTGEVWFLAGPFGSCVREARVPEGKWLFFPLVNSEASSLEQIPFKGCSPAEQAAAATAFSDYIRKPYLELDGTLLPDPKRYRVVTEQFHLTLPDVNCIGVPPGSSSDCDRFPSLSGPGRARPDIPPMKCTGVSDGYWAMVEPLPIGTHLIRFGGEFWSGGVCIGKVEATYFLTVF